ARGVAYMVDNCSTTARLGARKWGPRFDHLIEQEVFTSYDRTEQVDENRLQAFVQHPIHQALSICAELRPPIDISWPAYRTPSQAVRPVPSPCHCVGRGRPA